MDAHEQKLIQYMQSEKVIAEHKSFTESCHSVAEAARAVNGSPEDFVKNVCFIDKNNRFIVVIVKGEDKVDKNKVAQFLHVEQLRMATAQEILDETGYPCGGTPSFGFEAVFLIDPRVMEKEVVYTGGGSEHALVKITPHELQKANKGRVVQIRVGIKRM